MLHCMGCFVVVVLLGRLRCGSSSLRLKDIVVDDVVDGVAVVVVVDETNCLQNGD